MSTSFEAVLKPSEYFDVAVTFIRHGMSLMVKGAPGQGKTQITRQACAKANAVFIPIFLPVKDPVDLSGFPHITEDPLTGKKKADFIPFGDLAKIMEAADEPDRPYVVFADDIGNAAKLLQASWMQFVCEREMNGHKIPDNVVFISATNRKSDKTGVTGIIESLKNKHHAIVELITDLEDWSRWAADSSIAPEIRFFVRFAPKVLSSFEASTNADITTSPTPRGVEHCSDIFKTGINGALRAKLFTGAIGKEYSVQMEGFLRFFHELPNPDDVIADPHNAPIPQEPGHLYALCCALSERAKPSNVGPIITYANRLQDEFSAALVLDAVRKDRKNMCIGAEWIDWVSRHDHILI